MVWTIVIVLVILGLGWYFWSQQSPSITTPTPPADTSGANSQTPPAGASTQSSSTDQTGVSASVSANAGTAPMSATVSYNGTSFTPSSVSIAKGGTVTFTDTAGSNMWIASDPHPDHNGYDGTTRQQHCAPGYAGAAPFDMCQGGSSFSFTFDKTGSWGYHDHFNSAAFGTIVVK
jgi:plastocyanin